MPNSDGRSKLGKANPTPPTPRRQVDASETPNNAQVGELRTEVGPIALKIFTLFRRLGRSSVAIGPVGYGRAAKFAGGRSHLWFLGNPTVRGDS